MTATVTDSARAPGGSRRAIALLSLSQGFYTIMTMYFWCHGGEQKQSINKQSISSSIKKELIVFLFVIQKL